MTRARCNQPRLDPSAVRVLPHRDLDQGHGRIRGDDGGVALEGVLGVVEGEGAVDGGLLAGEGLGGDGVPGVTHHEGAAVRHGLGDQLWERSEGEERRETDRIGTRISLRRKWIEVALGGACAGRMVASQGRHTQMRTSARSDGFRKGRARTIRWAPSPPRSPCGPRGNAAEAFARSKISPPSSQRWATSRCGIPFRRRASPRSWSGAAGDFPWYALAGPRADRCARALAKRWRREGGSAARWVSTPTHAG